MQEQNMNSNAEPDENQRPDSNIPVNAPPVGQEGISNESNEKTMGGLAYLIFFLPLIVCPQSQYARFHANQALVLLIAAVAGNIILSLLPVIGWVLIPIFSICVVALEIYGLINGFTGKLKKLPVIGNITILK